MTTMRPIAFVLALALAAAACGDGSSSTTTDPTETLPPNPLAACEEGSPDCEDMLDGTQEPPLLPDEPDGGADPSSAPMVLGGGLTVPEALQTDAVGTIAVQGFVVLDAQGTRLCEALAESYPPQCGGAFLMLSGLETIDPDELQTAEGVTWSNEPVTVLGEITDGTLSVDPLSL